MSPRLARISYVAGSSGEQIQLQALEAREWVAQLDYGSLGVQQVAMLVRHRDHDVDHRVPIVWPCSLVHVSLPVSNWGPRSGTPQNSVLQYATDLTMSLKAVCASGTCWST